MARTPVTHQPVKPEQPKQTPPTPPTPAKPKDTITTKQAPASSPLPPEPVTMLTTAEVRDLFDCHEIDGDVLKAKCPLPHHETHNCWLTIQRRADGTRKFSCLGGGREAEFAKIKHVAVESLCGTQTASYQPSSLVGGDDPVGEVKRIKRLAQHAEENALADSANDAETREFTPEEIDAKEALGELIVIDHKALHEKTRLGIRALQRRNGDAPSLFLHGDVPVRVVAAQGHAAKIEPLDLNRLRHELDLATSWRKTSGRKTSLRVPLVPVTPPHDVCENILATSHLPLPQLVGLRDVPYFTPDGQVIVARGFHAVTGLYLDPPASLIVHVPEPPTYKDVRRAVALFGRMLRQFPFDGVLDTRESVRTPSFANMLGAILTPFVREMLPESAVTPLFAFDAPSAPGSGKTLLAKILSLIACGRELALAPPVESDEEMRKSILAELLQGHPFVVIDNAGERIGSRALASAMTAPVVSGRVLGVTRIVHVPNRATWLVTGNNLRFSGENLRRSVWVHLDPKCEYPEDRTGWDIPDLPGWVVVHRSALVSAALTLIRFWIAEGRPDWTGTPSGSFEAWARPVGGILETAGIEHFLGNRDEFRRRSDAEGNETRAFVEAWWARRQEQAVRVSEILLDAKEAMPRVFDRAGTLRGDQTALGTWLDRHDGTIVSGWRIVHRPRAVRDETYRTYRDGWALERSEA